jgi:hypothetical protein
VSESEEEEDEEEEEIVTVSQLPTGENRATDMEQGATVTARETPAETATTAEMEAATEMEEEEVIFPGGGIHLGEEY